MTSDDTDTLVLQYVLRCRRSHTNGVTAMGPTSAVFHRDLAHEPVWAVVAQHASIHEWRDGAHVIDISSGAGVTCLGYSAKRVKDAMRQQISELPYMHAANWSCSAVEVLARELLTRADGHFKNGRVIFLNTGAEAIEAACKLSMQYHLERYDPTGHAQPARMSRSAFYARQHSYHGATAFTLALGDHPRKVAYHGQLSEHNVQRMRAFKPRWDNPADIALYRNDVLSRLTSSMLPNSTVVIEPIGGTAVAIEPADPEYLTMVRNACDASKSLLIYDEILCGSFRTGHMFAHQTIHDLQPDMICIGKGLTAGYFPLSAVIVADHVVDVIARGSGRLWHSTTNQNHPLGCAAGLAALRTYDEMHATGTLRALEHALDDCASVIKRNPNVQDVTGIGTLRAIRLHASGKIDHRAMQRDLLRRGVAVYTEGHTVTGTDNMILIAPPYCITTEELWTAFAVIDGYLMEQML